MKLRLISIIILTLAVISAKAQDDFNPPLPGEPNAYYKVSVKIVPEEAGSVSGSGQFMSGMKTRISTSSTIDYTFSHWTLNGETYSEERAFDFTVGTENAEFVAVYDYTPVDIDDYTSIVCLEASPSDACSFNITSGNRYGEDTWVYVNATPNQNFVFKGWYKGSELVNSNLGFNYLVGADNVTLTAKFDYTPSLPDDPGATGQEDVSNTPFADITGDGEVDVQDVVSSINFVLSGETNNKADISGDGIVDVQDVVSLINIILKNK